MAAIDDTWNWIYPALQELKNSSDQSWETRRQNFLIQLDVRDPDDDPVVGELVRQLDELSDTDRGSILDSDQLDTMAYEVIQTQIIEPATADQATSDYDEAAWHEYLTTNGSAWDGTVGSWTTFHEWFAYHADERGLSVPATAFLDNLDNMSVTERVATFAQHGVTIAAPAPSGGEFAWVTAEQAEALQGVWGANWTQPLAADLTARWGPDWADNPDEHKTAWLGDLIASGALAGVDQDALLAKFAEQVHSIPGIEKMSNEEITRIITDTLNQAGRQKP